MSSHSTADAVVSSRAISILLALLPLGLLALVATPPAKAADAPDAARPAARREAKGPLAAVAPFIDEQTVAVLRLDVSRTDPKGIEAWLNSAVQGARPGSKAPVDPELARAFSDDLAHTRPATEAWLGRFTKAGVRDVYLLVSLADITQPPAYVVPLSESADAKAIERLFAPADPGAPGAPREPAPLHSYGFGSRDSSDPSDAPAAEQVGGVVVAAPANVLRRLRALKSAERPDLAEALAAAGDAPLAVAFAPPEDARRVIEQLLPKLPPELGGGASGPVARGLRWASLAVRFPPAPSLALTVRASDAGAAKALAVVADAAGHWLAEHRAGIAKSDPDLGPLLTLALAVIPHPSADHPDELAARLDGAAMQDLAATEVAEMVKSYSARSADNMKQILLGCIMFVNQDVKTNAWPHSLEAVLKTQDILPRVFINPAHPENPVGYTYLNPGRQKDIKDDAHVVVLYETAGGPNGRNVGFADGHVEFMDEGKFQEALKAAKERLEK